MTYDMKLQDHLAGGVTTLCRCWSLTRRDGVLHGFTDHDRDLVIEGVLYRADTGMTALALQQATGLSVDNTEAIGALSDGSITEVDIEAGRYDGAEVTCWLVNWTDVSQRAMQFRGMLGELRRASGAFEVELLGLTDLLNRAQGRIYQKSCTAVLGDGACAKDLSAPGYWAEAPVQGVVGSRLVLPELPGFEDGWFRRGALVVMDGAAKGLTGVIKRDDIEGAHRQITLWAALGAGLSQGDHVRLTAGCDKRMETCRNKFENLVNFQGFPDIPGNDWSMAVPASATAHGGSRR